VHEALPTLFVIYAGYRYGWDTREGWRSLSSVSARPPSAAAS
jgi:hypothetical protein